MIRVFIGYDKSEAVAYNVLQHSIVTRASQPVSITPLIRRQLQPPLTKERDELASTDFVDTRFLVPYLSNYEGWSLFLDCDFICNEDITALWQLRDDNYAVMCRKHALTTLSPYKFLGHKQISYPKKNWASFMLFNNARCKALTVDYVNQAANLDLLQFKWLNDDALIGDLPTRFNHLVGINQEDSNAAWIHFTLGIPAFTEYADCEWAQQWRREYNKLLFCRQRVVSVKEAVAK